MKLSDIQSTATADQPPPSAPGSKKLKLSDVTSAEYGEAERSGLAPTQTGRFRGLDPKQMVAGATDIAAPIVSYLDEARGMEPDVDYDKGANSVLAKWWLSRSDNPKEAQLALEHLYGPENVGQDKGGRWWVREGGKKIEVYGGGQELETALKKDYYAVLSYSPVLGGAVTGAALGEGAAPEFSPISGIVGAGVGAPAGKAVDELVKALQGVYAKTPKQEIDKLGSEAMWNMAYESLGPAARAILNPLKRGLRSFFGITPEGEAMTREIAKGGGRPPLKTSVPGMTGLQWHQEFRNKIMGDPKAARNVAYIRAQLHNILTDAGYSKSEVDEMMAELTQKDAAISGTKEGEAISEKIASHIESLRNEANSAVTTAHAAVDAELKDLKGLGAKDPGDLGHDVAKTIVTARQRFGQAMGRAYERITEMTRGQPVVETSGIKAEVKPILDSLPETMHPPILKKIADLPGYITIKDAHAYRSELRQMAFTGNLTPGLSEHNLWDASNAFDNAISESGERMEAAGLPNAAKALREVDNQYREGIAKFRDVMFNQMVRRARTGIFPDAGTVATQLIRPGETERLKTFWSFAPPELRTRIAYADMSNILKASKDSSINFYDEVKRRGPMLDMVYGAAEAAKLRKGAKELAALDGKLPETETLEPGRVSKAINDQIEWLTQVDQFVKENPIAALGVPKAADRAVRYIAAPGRENVTREAMLFFGPDSPEWKSIQKYALKDVLSRAIVQSPSLAPTVVGDAMKGVLSKYTREQLDMLFPNGLDSDLRVLADKANFLFPHSEGDMSAGLAAGAVKGGLPFTLPAYVYAKLWGYLGDHPIWFHNLASAARSGDTSEVKSIAKMLMTLAIRPIGHTGPGYGSPDQSGSK